MGFDDLGQRASALFQRAVDPSILHYLLVLKHHDRILLYVSIAAALAFGILIGRHGSSRAVRASALQNSSEALVSSVTRMNFGPPDYHLMNHITIRMEDGTTQIDHILVSRFGVFVIETKHYKGWIFAIGDQKEWTQVLFRLRFRFQNPIHQNLRHIRAVQSLLDFLPPDAIKSIVVFTGDATFKTEMPQGVFTISGFVDHLRNQTDEVMSLNRMQFCVGRLETARLAISFQTDVEHAQSLKRRHGGTA